MRRHPDDTEWIARKTASLRIFNDESGVMNLSLTDTGGEILAVSQFTLTASTRKGNRPSYIRAARGDEASELYDLYCRRLSGADRHGSEARSVRAPTWPWI